MSKVRGEYLPRMLDVLAASRPANRTLWIVETGCLRRKEDDYRSGDGWSTLYLALWCQGKNARLDSVDCDPAAIQTAREVLTEHGLGDLPNVVFHQRIAEEWLREWAGPIDFAYLDAHPAPEQNLAEFLEVRKRLRPPALVVIDDCFELAEDRNKGRKTLEYLREQGTQGVILRCGRMAMIPFGTFDWSGLQRLEELP